jgi:hypothetical protein
MVGAGPNVARPINIFSRINMARLIRKEQAFISKTYR